MFDYNLLPSFESTYSLLGQWPMSKLILQGILTSVLSGLGFVFLAVIVEYIKKYRRDKIEKGNAKLFTQMLKNRGLKEVIGPDGTRVFVPNNDTKTKGESLFQAYKQSGNFLGFRKDSLTSLSTKYDSTVTNDITEASGDSISKRPLFTQSEKDSEDAQVSDSKKLGAKQIADKDKHGKQKDRKKPEQEDSQHVPSKTQNLHSDSDQRMWKEPLPKEVNLENMATAMTKAVKQELLKDYPFIKSQLRKQLKKDPQARHGDHAPQAFGKAKTPSPRSSPNLYTVDRSPTRKTRVDDTGKVNSSSPHASPITNYHPRRGIGPPRCSTFKDLPKANRLRKQLKPHLSELDANHDNKYKLCAGNGEPQWWVHPGKSNLKDTLRKQSNLKDTLRKHSNLKDTLRKQSNIKDTLRKPCSCLAGTDPHETQSASHSVMYGSRSSPPASKEKPPSGPQLSAKSKDETTKVKKSDESAVLSQKSPRKKRKASIRRMKYESPPKCPQRKADEDTRQQKFKEDTKPPSGSKDRSKRVVKDGAKRVTKHDSKLSNRGSQKEVSRWPTKEDLKRMSRDVSPRSTSKKRSPPRGKFPRSRSPSARAKERSRSPLKRNVIQKSFKKTTKSKNTKRARSKSPKNKSQKNKQGKAVANRKQLAPDVFKDRRLKKNKKCDRRQTSVNIFLTNSEEAVQLARSHIYESSSQHLQSSASSQGLEYELITAKELAERLLDSAKLDMLTSSFIPIQNASSQSPDAVPVENIAVLEASLLSPQETNPAQQTVTVEVQKVPAEYSMYGTGDKQSNQLELSPTRLGSLPNLEKPVFALRKSKLDEMVCSVTKEPSGQTPFQINDKLVNTDYDKNPDKMLQKPPGAKPLGLGIKPISVEDTYAKQIYNDCTCCAAGDKKDLDAEKVIIQMFAESEYVDRSQTLESYENISGLQLATDEECVCTISASSDQYTSSANNPPDMKPGSVPRVVLSKTCESRCGQNFDVLTTLENPHTAIFGSNASFEVNGFEGWKEKEQTCPPFSESQYNGPAFADYRR